MRRFIDRSLAVETMAKSDSFFIRAKVVVSGVTYNQTEIDLGSFVNLGVSKSTLLRVHNIQAMYLDDNDTDSMIYYDGGIPGAEVRWQLCTQTQSALISSDDKSFISGGCYRQASTVDNLVQTADEVANNNVHEWTNGYLIGVDSIFMGADSSGTWDTADVRISLVLECTLENATQASSTALALSQQ